MRLKRRTLRVSGIIIGVGVVVYAGVAVLLYAAQRLLLFPISQDDALSEPSALAIPGSQRLTLVTEDGERLAAWYVAPDSPLNSGQPVFLFFHGNGGGLEYMTERWRQIRSHGAGVLAVSYRGYPGSTGQPSEAGLRLDARAAYDWLRVRHGAGQIVVHGLSLGSGVAVRLASEVEVRAVILEAPFTAAVDVAAELYPWLPVHLLMTDQFRSRDHIANVRAPVLIAHGDRDSNIPFAHGERLFALAHEPKTFARIVGGDHHTLARDGLYDHVWRFLESAPQKARGSPL